jgi:hypothetical protein
MKLPAQHWLKVVLLVTMLVFAGVAFYLYALRFFAWVESDAAVSVVLAGKMLDARMPVVASWYYANGDVWVVGPQLIALVPVAILGVGPASLLITVVAGFALEILALVKLYARMCGEQWVAVLATMVTLMAWSSGHVAFVYIQLAYGFLTVLYVLAFGGLARMIESPTAKRLVGASLLVAMLAVQNPARGLVFVVAPVLAASFWPWRDVAWRTRIALGAAAVAGWMIAVVVYGQVFARFVQFSVPRGHIDFVVTGASGIAHNLATLGEGLALMCGGGLAAIPGIALLAGALVLVVREILASRAVTPMRFYAVIVVAQLGVVLVPLLVGNLLVSTNSVRYLMPSLLMLFGLAAMLAARALPNKLAAAWLVLIPIAALAAVPGARPPDPEQYGWPDTDELRTLAGELETRGLTHGFANVLSANVLNLDSHARTLACPVFFRDYLIPQRWLADTRCYTPSELPKKFYVVIDQADHDRAALGKTLPAPVERFHVGPTYEVTVFETSPATIAWLEQPILDGDLAFPLHVPMTHLAIGRGNATFDGTDLVATGAPGSIAFGPYMTLPRGRYEVTWSGAGLDDAGHFAFSVRADGEVIVQREMLGKDVPRTAGALVKLSFKLDRTRTGIEFPVETAGGARLSLHELVIAKP